MSGPTLPRADDGPLAVRTATGTDVRDASRTHIRGSSLLLLGRLLSMAVNFGVQVLIVRHLSQESYGAFAYALSLVALGTTVITFGLDRAVTRFVPIYDERGDRERLLGTVVLVLGTVLALGLVVVSGTIAARGLLEGRLIADQEAVAVLLILILLAPIDALDTVSIGLFAVFARPRAIFFRRYVLAPGLRLAVVVLLVLQQAGTTFLAAGYVVAGAVGVGLYGSILVRALRQQGLLGPGALRSVRIPAREILAFTVPLLSSDLVYTVMNVSDAIMLGYFHGTSEIASVRAVQPVAKLNQIVMSSFALMFMPLAARLFARRDAAGVNDLYWHTAMWTTVLTFPVFAVSFALAGPVTETLFGARYADSATFLSILALGYYVQAALGFNGLTLKAFGAVRVIVVLNVVAALANVVANLLLIPAFGALGAAIGTLLALLAHNALKQIGLRRVAGVHLLDRRSLRVYGTVTVCIAALALAQRMWAPPLLLGIALAALACVPVVGVAREGLRVGHAFPELLRYPFMRRLAGEDGPPAT